MYVVDYADDVDGKIQVNSISEADDIYKRKADVNGVIGP